MLQSRQTTRRGLIAMDRDVDPERLVDEEGRLAALARCRIIETARDENFDKITALVRDVLDVPIAAVSLVERDRQWFKSIQGLAVAETPRDIAFCGHTILQRDPLIVPDATADVRFSTNPLVTGDPAIRSYAGVPLRTSDGYNVGSLCAIDTRARDFSEAQIRILARFAGLVVNEMELRTIAHHDFLTGAVTRRAFTEATESAVDRMNCYNRVSSMIMFDLDHFKTINDSLGHPAGDQVLKAVAELCLYTLRPSDIFGRLGGEEFGILLREIGDKGALAIAERLRDGMSKLTFAWAPGLSVTSSFGVTALKAKQSSDEWMRVTDDALYLAKRAGRNRIFTGEFVSRNVAA